MRSVSIKLKLGVGVVVCLFVIAAANAIVSRQSFLGEMRFAGEQAVAVAARSFASLEKREIDKLSTALDALVGEPTFAALYALGERDRLLEAAAPIFRELKQRHNVTHWYFIDPAPTPKCFLRVHRPALHDDVVNRQTLLAAMRTGDTAAGKELGLTAFALRVVRPFAPQGKLLGYMELGQEIDDFLARMKAETGNDFALVIDKRFLDEAAWAASRGERRNNWGDDPGTVVVESTSSEPGLAGTAADLRDVSQSGRFLGSLERGGRLFVRGVVSVHDAAGQKVGGLFVLQDVTPLRDRLMAEQKRAILLIVAVAVLVLALLYALFEVLVFRRLVRMTATLQRLSARLVGGDYEVGETIHPTARDEIGRFEAFLGGFLSTLGATLREMEKRLRKTG